MNGVALIFPGQGAFHGGALRKTHLSYPTVHRVLDVVEVVAQRRFGRSLLAAMWNEKSTAAHLLQTDPEMLQLAIYGLSVAAFELLRAEGVQHDVLMGHSFGEIAALTCAGVFTVEHGAEIVCDRVEALTLAAPRDGRMAAVSTGRQQVRDAIERYSMARGEARVGSRLQIAVENSDFQTVVSGPRAEIDGFIPHCVELGLSAQALNSPYAFHHDSLAPAASEFSKRTRQRPSSAPACRVYSPILGRYYRPDDDFTGQLSNHLTQTVNFFSGIRGLAADGISTFIECGALDALTKNIIRILGPGNGKAFPTLGHTPDNLSHLNRITTHLNQLKQLQRMNSNTPSPAPTSSRLDFESFWRDRSPVIMSLLKAEFLQFLNSAAATPAPVVPVQLIPEPTPVAAPVPPPIRETTLMTRDASGAGVFTIPLNGHSNGRPSSLMSREKMFEELVTIYADAMEYPREVFTETVELEAELGIDSVKQSEIIRRISAQYSLPPLPANFRAGDFKTMGKIVDFVFSQQGQATASAA